MLVNGRMTLGTGKVSCGTLPIAPTKVHSRTICRKAMGYIFGTRQVQVTKVSGKAIKGTGKAHGRKEMLLTQELGELINPKGKGFKFHKLGIAMKETSYQVKNMD
jgi:hypothetical protein